MNWTRVRSGHYLAGIDEPVHIDELAGAVEDSLTNLYEDSSVDVTGDQTRDYSVDVAGTPASVTMTLTSAGELESVEVEDVHGNRDEATMYDDLPVRDGYDVTADLAACDVTVAFYEDDDTGHTQSYHTMVVSEPDGLIDNLRTMAGRSSIDSAHPDVVDALDDLEQAVGDQLDVDVERLYDMQQF